ncbi:hypothetical protein CHGG_09287 [Chaetomium globosum CBS 148.51]|uniref:DNA-binding protein RAP1 n=1 Tax=Chaetomium globosum (strain ATCC 6205 / CBS 148.51 / DSM 1962 / NBRC 6347 / NRRL 1970) TaxID=306901 RepID=Q2GRW7_CHAGB|nr:uncharacterized protein CHGG_09287 [Chaetomium globosum CBS 148.51]EAQ85273.1 hypothetical protein CHGG_09287 [Chaetomium globosum CBS 148.51]
MAPPIVYDGVNGKYEGTLFNGLKYWVSRRVPTRSLILDKIKDNGGKIVELEKHADILIADHIWKDCPPRSVSWKYINDCVAAGELVNIEDYYPYPNHPWQSWRDKWVNKMSLLSEDQLPPVLPKLPPPHTQPSNKAQAAPDTSAPSARPTPPEPTAPTSPRRGSNVRIRFTNEEDKMLVKYVAERIQMGKKPKGKEIYQKLEEKACGLSPTGTQAEPRDEGRVSTTEKGPSVVPQHDAEPTDPEEAEDEPGQTDQHATPAGPRTTLVLSREDFWRTFNEYNELNCVLPGPWAQVDSLAVDFWDLWQCATGEPDHAFRNWEVVAEELGFDWIAEPHVPVHLKVAFEKHLLGFEEALREFDQWDEGEEEEEDGEGEDDEEVQEVHEKWVGVEEANDNETASQDSDANFVSSPPINLKRARVSSQTPFSSSVRKRPRYDPNVEVPETPQMRAEKAGQTVAGARAVASNQHTPTRHPRYSVPSREPAEMEAHYSRPIPQYDGAEDEALLSPSQQLRSEIEATAFQREPARGTQSATSSAKPPVLSDGDETSDSNSGFEAIDNLLVKPPPPRENRHRQTLPWSEGKGKQPATALTHTPQPPPRAHTTTTTTTTTTQPTPRPHPLSTPHTGTTIRTQCHPPTATSTGPPDPEPVLNNYSRAEALSRLAFIAARLSSFRRGLSEGFR